MKYLWRWYPAKDEWELVTQAESGMARKVLAKYKRRDARTSRYKWTLTNKAPKRFRTRSK